MEMVRPTERVQAHLVASYKCSGPISRLRPTPIDRINILPGSPCIVSTMCPWYNYQRRCAEFLSVIDYRAVGLVHAS